MTVDLLAATLFWPEGTLLHLREDLSSGDGAEDPPAARDPDPPPESEAETFWAGVLRQMGWPLPPKPALHR